jgi:biopolymer transport protein TolQ
MLVKKLLAIASVGGTAVLYILIALSVLSIGIIIERAIWFRRRRVDTGKLGRELNKLLENEDVDGAKALLARHASVEAAVVCEALDWYDAGPEAIQEILDKGLADHRKEFESGLVFLGTLGNNAPFVGLFGTVLGIVTAFKELSNTAAGAATGQGGMGNVMSGISEALVATAIGILVALPAVISFNIFQKRTVVIGDNVGALGNVVIAHIQKARALEERTTRPGNGAVRGREHERVIEAEA